MVNVQVDSGTMCLVEPLGEGNVGLDWQWRVGEEPQILCVAKSLGGSTDGPE